MSLFSRVKNLYRLSAYEPGQPNEEYKTPGTEVSMIVKKPIGRFIPRITRDPVKEIVNEQP